MVVSQEEKARIEADVQLRNDVKDALERLDKIEKNLKWAAYALGFAVLTQAPETVPKLLALVVK